MKGKGTRIDKSIFKKKSKVEKTVYLILRLTYINQGTMVSVERYTHRLMEQNREPRNKTTQICQLIFDEVAEEIQWRKKSLFYK